MMAYAKVVEVINKQALIKLNSDNMNSSIPYYYIDSYTPIVGDTVIVDTKLHCVIGKVVL